ncbi:MAG: hypothetical protein ACYTFY_14390 [Planctomycetota bacterium]
MPGIEHKLITEAALSLLPDWQNELIGSEKNNLLEEYCKYPDLYFGVAGDRHEKASPYYYETDNIQFHYIPDTPIAEKYRYWQVNDNKLELPQQPENLNWKHACNGFKYYFEESVKCLKENKIKDAMSFAGCLIHMLEDSTFSLHSLEGPYGTDLFVLDRLFDFGDDPNKMPSNLMAEPTPEEAIVCPKHTPCCFGKSIAEAVFILYTDYVNASLAARKLTFKIIQNKLADKECKNLYREMFEKSVKLIADVLNTIFCLAAEKGKSSDRFLSDIEPVERPWGLGFYRFVTLLRDRALNTEKELVPLQLVVEGEEKSFAKGISFGSHIDFSFCYEIPENTYESFSCILGLQAEFVETGEVTIKIINKGNIVFEDTFNKDNPSAEITVNNPGGKFKITGTSPEAAKLVTVTALCEPILKVKT